MSIRHICSAIWHASRFGRTRTAIVFITIAAPFVLYLLHIFPRTKLLLAVWVGAITVGASFILPLLYFGLIRRHDLEDPLRHVTYRQRRKIIEYLKLYGQKGMNGQVCRVIRLHYYPRVRDAHSLGTEIRETLQDAGWAADIEDTDANSEPPIHGSGLWVYGESRGDPNPPTAKLLQGAFGTIGLPLHIDPDHYGEQGTCLVVGRWECPWGLRHAAFKGGPNGGKPTTSSTFQR